VLWESQSGHGLKQLRCIDAAKVAADVLA